MSGGAAAQTTSCYGRQIQTFNFQSPVLESGTALSVGAVYRFSNVATGIDARVTIDAITNASLAIMDRDTGLIANFQPELAGSDARSIDFTIRLVAAGTTTPVSADFAASGIDIDGDSGTIREYAEFSNGFAAYVVDSPTNLDINASGPSVAGNTRFESRTNFTAPGIDPTATANIVAVFYTATSSFKYRIGTLGTGASTRLNSLDFSCPALAIPTPSQITPQDFGDAPAAYGNPEHDIVAGIRLGATNTAELARYNSPTASGDAGDDGVIIPTLIQGRSATITATVAGAGGYLQGWIDWNRDGDFADPGEQIATNIRDNLVGDTNLATGLIGIAVVVPVTATVNPTFARFRWSTQSGLGALLTASNGEVEDYALTISAGAALSITKSNAIYSAIVGVPFAIPGNDVTYSLTTTNIGSGPTDANSVFVVDTLPAQVTFYNGDIDGPGPATGAAYFTQTGTSLSFNLATDLAFSNLVAVPASFAACTYAPIAGYDVAVKHVCFNPKGSIPSGIPAPSFTVQFRTAIK